MKPQELFTQVKNLIEKKDFQAAQQFIMANKDELGDYFEQAKQLLGHAKSSNQLFDSVKGFFGK